MSAPQKVATPRRKARKPQKARSITYDLIYPFEHPTTGEQVESFTFQRLAVGDLLSEAANEADTTSDIESALSFAAHIARESVEVIKLVDLEDWTEIQAILENFTPGGKKDKTPAN